MRKLVTTFFAISAIAIVIAALWTWRHAASVAASANDAPVNLAAAKSLAVDGDAMVDVAKGDGAHYRINIQKSKVTDVQLESDRDGCYE